ncbi:MAG: hypothetical protein LPK02_07375 [Rhodobacterales bacterium]|nr:hypothetical protein [Rhodobacterales bacterium]
MAKSAEITLFGVKHYNPTHHGVPAHHWAQMRAPGAWGFMNDHDRMSIVWFNDIGAREEFIALFGGLRVTLRRKDETLVGEKAADFLRNARSGMSSVS